jgi:hypothetical protein
MEFYGHESGFAFDNPVFPGFIESVNHSLLWEHQSEACTIILPVWVGETA